MTKCKLNAWRNIQLTILFFVIAPQVTAPTWQQQISLTSYQRRWRQRSSWLLRSPWEQKCLRRTSGTSCICVTRCVCVCVLQMCTCLCVCVYESIPFCVFGHVVIKNVVRTGIPLRRPSECVCVCVCVCVLCV